MSIRRDYWDTSATYTGPAVIRLGRPPERRGQFLHININYVATYIFIYWTAMPGIFNLEIMYLVLLARSTRRSIGIGVASVIGFSVCSVIFFLILLWYNIWPPHHELQCIYPVFAVRVKLRRHIKAECEYNFDICTRKI